MRKSESEIKTACQVDACRVGGRLWRNNVGAGKLENGEFMRWGLCNESAATNKLIKSSDLIGIKPVTITQEMVGTVIGQFWAVETKPEDWDYSGKGRELAQKVFLELVKQFGGCSEFNNTGEFK